MTPWNFIIKFSKKLSLNKWRKNIEFLEVPYIYICTDTICWQRQWTCQSMFTLISGDRYSIDDN